MIHILVSMATHVVAAFVGAAAAVLWFYTSG